MQKVEPLQHRDPPERPMVEMAPEVGAEAAPDPGTPLVAEVGAEQDQDPTERKAE